MTISDLSPKIIAAIKARRFDWFVEKHEGPWLWADFWEDCDFLELDGHWVLLPLFSENRPNIKLLRCLESKDGRALTLFLKDTTHVMNPAREWAEAGYFAVCEKFEREDFFITTYYHQCYLLDEMPKPNPGKAQQ